MRFRLNLPRFLLVCIVYAASLSGCGLMEPSALPPPPPSMAKVSLDLFAVRGFLGGSDYEHYTLKDGYLWRECGSLAPKGKSAPSETEQLKTLQVKQKRIEALTAVSQQPIVKGIDSVLKVYSKAEVTKLPKPESVRSIGDGGLFELKLSDGHSESVFTTNVDVVSEPKTKLLEEIKDLFQTVRTVGPVICNSKTFFGISRKVR